MLKGLFPGEEGGYTKSTGGQPNDLALVASNDMVKDYHKRYYSPERLTVFVFGPITAKDVAKVVNDAEDAYVADHPEKYEDHDGDFGGPGERGHDWPFGGTDYRMPDAHDDRSVKYSAQGTDTIHGQVYVGWRMPFKMMNDLPKWRSVRALLSYLGYSHLSKLRKTFIEGDDPIANGAYMSYSSFTHPVVYAVVTNVPRDRYSGVHFCRQSLYRLRLFPPSFPSYLRDIPRRHLEGLVEGRVE